jgi:hypothetical protein
MAKKPQNKTQEIIEEKIENLEADQALIDRKIDGLVAAVHENDRPLSGLAGLLDWRFHGVISKCLRAGAITGKVGECVYFPVTKNGNTYKLILLGVGSSSTISPDALKPLQKNLKGLNLEQVGISNKDFGNPPEDFLSKNLKGISFRVTL